MLALRFAAVLLVVSLASWLGLAQKPMPKKPSTPLEEANARLLHGNYDEAREAFADLAKADASVAPQCTIGLAKSYVLIGDVAKAKTLLSDGAKAYPKNADVLAARSDLMHFTGDWDEAEKDADAAIAINPNQVLARYTKARLLRDRGKVDEAKEAFRWAVRYYNQADKLTPEELVYVSECAAEYARWIRNSKQFAFILNEVIKDATKQDATYWPAEQFAGMLLLEKYNRPDAIDAFDAVLKINPKAADPLVGKALAALVKFDLKDADAYAEQALKQNPKHVGALRVKAEIYLTAGDLPAAEKVLLEAKAVSPKDSATLGRLAGVYVLEKKAAEFEAVVKFVNSFDSKPGEFYHELGKVLEDRKQYAKAEEYYKKSYELRPVLSAPRTGLGMLYLRLGNEKEGRVLLDEAFKADPFNIRVSNSRKVLAHLDNYKTVETAHYILKYDEKTDALLGEWMAEFLEETHAELKQQFQFEPEGKFVIEIFNSHEMFSGRTVGLPDLHTIGACTGRVVAMASPKAKGLAKPFNWGRVMRHELTHIFNLAQTDYKCPHWITEGLAVVNERMSRPPMWSQILRDRYESKTLLNLDTIMMGFVRPKGPDEWTLAYCQSQLYVEYMVQAHGPDSVGKILTEFKKSANTASAIKNACGVDQATFEKGYQEFVTKVVKGMSAPTSAKGKEEKAKTVDELIEAVKKDPKDDDSAAKLAEAYLRRGKVADAKKLADGILERDPNHAGGCVVKAKLLARAGEDDEANAMLQKALKAKPDDPKLLGAVGKLLVEQKKYEEAAKMLEKGRALAPLDGDWLDQLARIYKETKDNDKLIPILSTMVSQDPDDLPARTTLAKLCLDAKKYAEAEQYARDALMIDVANLSAKDVLVEALNQRGKKAEADKIKKRYEKVTAVDE